MNSPLLGLIVALSLVPLFPPAAQADYFKKIEPRLFQVVDGKRVDYKKPATYPKYTALYYSAHWCPPCRAFTPKLVEWYKDFKAKHDNFELVFVSSDESEKAQIEYMKEAGMPWPAVKFSATSDPNFRKYAPSGIPYLVLIGEDGKELTEKESAGKTLQKISEMVK